MDPPIHTGFFTLVKHFDLDQYPWCLVRGLFCLCRTQAGDVDVRCCTCSWPCCAQEGKTSPCLLAPRDHGAQDGQELCESSAQRETILYVDIGMQTCAWTHMDTENVLSALCLETSRPHLFSRTLRLLVTHNVAPTLAAPVYNQVNQEQILKACSRAPVFEYTPPAPATSDAHSQQLSRVYTTTTVTTDVNLDTIGLVYPKFPALLWSFFRHRSLVLSTF